jgi:hypothetical protein
MVVDAYVVTYAPDARWLSYLVKSWIKYARGFRRMLILYPSQHTAAFTEMQGFFKSFPSIVWQPFNEREGHGHMHHNIIKCRADEYTDAEFILHIDSDCVLMGKISPEDFFTNGRPDLLYSKFSDIQSPWQYVTELALGRSVEVETMRRHPFVYPRWMYAEMRNRVEHVHRRPFDEYVFTAPCMGGAHRGFSEFCTLGAYAKHFRPEAFHFYDTKTSCKPCDVRQYWSFSGITEQERYELDGYTRDWDKPRIFDR